MTKVKICGIRTLEALQSAERAGAHFAGFVFYPKSVRNIAPEAAAQLARQTGLSTVGLFVNPDDDTLQRVLATVPLAYIQLHGHETPERVAAVKSLSGLPVIKALAVATGADLAQTRNHEQVADWLLLDAKTEGQAGGTGQAFDWTILQGWQCRIPWMLAGGLNAGNVAPAIRQLAPAGVDVSSGVESAPGMKDACKIAAFVESVRHA